MSRQMLSQQPFQMGRLPSQRRRQRRREPRASHPSANPRPTRRQRMQRTSRLLKLPAEACSQHSRADGSHLIRLTRTLLKGTSGREVGRCSTKKACSPPGLVIRTVNLSSTDHAEDCKASWQAVVAIAIMRPSVSRSRDHAILDSSSVSAPGCEAATTANVWHAVIHIQTFLRQSRCCCQLPPAAQLGFWDSQ